MLPFPAYRMDDMRARAGAVTARCFNGSRKRYGSATDTTKSTVDRHFKGVNSPSLRFLMQVASADKATAFPLLAEAISVVNQVQIERAPTAELQKRLAEIDELEHDADGDEDRQRMRAAVNPTPEQRRASALADRRIAELALERAAIQDELALRGA